MKKLKMFENYQIKEFTEEDLEYAMILMTEWLLEITMEGNVPDMSAEAKSKQIIQEVREGRLQFSMPGLTKRWSRVSVSEPFKKWTSTFTRNR